MKKIRLPLVLVVMIATLTFTGTVLASPIAPVFGPGSSSTCETTSDLFGGNFLNLQTVAVWFYGDTIPAGGQACGNIIAQSSLAGTYGAPRWERDYVTDAVNFSLTDGDGRVASFFRHPVPVCFVVPFNTTARINLWYAGDDFNAAHWTQYPTHSRINLGDSHIICSNTRIAGVYTVIEPQKATITQSS